MQETKTYDTVQEVFDEIDMQQPLRFRIEPCGPDGQVPGCCLTGTSDRTEESTAFTVELGFDDSLDGTRRLDRFRQWPHHSRFEEHTSDEGVSYACDIDEDDDEDDKDLRTAALDMMNLVLKNIYEYDNATPFQYRLTEVWCPYCGFGDSCDHLLLSLTECNEDLVGDAFPVDKLIGILERVCLECVKRLSGLDNDGRQKMISGTGPDRLQTLLEEVWEEWGPEETDENFELDASDFCLGFHTLTSYLDSILSDIPGVRVVQSDVNGGFPGCSDSVINYWAEDAVRAVEEAMAIVREDAARLGQMGTPKDVEPATDTSQTADDGFVASKNSEVFHRPGCKSAAKILEKNVVRYANRDEAVQAGKRPCGECGP